MTETQIQPGTVLNTFTNGMIQDLEPQFMKSDSYYYALNAVHNSHQYRGGFLVNEKSNKLCASFSSKVVGISYIDERNQSLVFTADSAISLFDHESCEVTQLIVGSNYPNDDSCARDIITRGCWDFSKCEMMYAEFKTMQPCNELHAYFSSGCHLYVINIDELLEPERKACLSCKDFRLMKCSNTPHITPVVSETGGNGLEAGAYYFITQLQDRDGNQTNWNFVKGPAMVGSENNISGEESTAVIDLRIDCLDRRYNKVNIAVIKKIDGQLREPELIYSGHFASNGMSVRYYSRGQNLRTLSFEEVFFKRKTYIRAQDLFQKDGMLWLYKIKQERNLNYQGRANNITGRVIVQEVAAPYAHLYPSLQRNERYQPAIVWIYCDDTESAAFPIFPTSGPNSRPIDSDGPDGGGALGDADDLVTNTRAFKPSNDTPGTGGGSARSSDEYIPHQLIRRRVKMVASSYTSGAPNGPDPYSVPEDKKKEPIDVAQEAAINGFTTELGDLVEAVDIDEEAEKAQQCLCTQGGAGGGTSTTTTGFSPTGDTTPGGDAIFSDSAGTASISSNGIFVFIDNNGDIITDSDGNPIEAQPGSSTTSSAICCPSGSPGTGDPAETATREDFSDYEDSYASWSDWIAEYGMDKETPNLVTSTFKDAANRLYSKAVDEREVVMYVGGGYRETGGSTGSQDGVSYSRAGSSTLKDAEGYEVKEGQPRFIGYANHKTYFTDNLFPDQKDCDGQRMYPTGRIPLFEMPSEDEEPLIRTTQRGVVSQFTPENSEMGNTYVRLLGFEFSGIEFPRPEELPKPLSCTNPYKIVYVKRDEFNSSVIANGAFFGTFNGDIRGHVHAFPRHGANSVENVDRHVDNNGSRIGERAATNRYVFHSPDTSLRRPSLISSSIKYAGSIGGTGFRHGLYVKGKEPAENQDHGTRIDNKGARHSLNLNQFSPGGGEIGVSGIMYAESDMLVPAVAGIDMPLMNKFRESSVYLQTEGQLPGLGGGYSITGHEDRSFLGDVLDHVAPIEGETWKGSLIRDVPLQYGNVENQTYIELGLNANKNTGNTIRGHCGDVYINMHSIKRTGWVSEKVGDEYNIPALIPHKDKMRTICDSPDDEIFMFTGNNFYPTRIPETGDAADAKNWAGLRTVPSAFTRPTRTRTINLQTSIPGAWETAAAGPDSDFYYPQVTKCLVTFWCESKVNTKFRQTGTGPQVQTGKVFYPMLKDLALDANAPTQHPWETSWLTRFYARVEQPSRHKIKMKAAIRNLLVLIMPMIGTAGMAMIEPLTGIVGAALGGGSLIAIWQLMVRHLASDDNLNRLLGFPTCKTDSEGTDDGSEIVNFEDNYFEINSDFAEVNDLMPFYGMPENYYTCDCDDCENGEHTNEIYHSQKQVLNSQIDSYRNFHALQFNTIDADSGTLEKLFVQGNTFYAQTTDTIFTLQNRLLDGSADSTLLVQPLKAMEGIKEGFMGTVDPNASINTPYGYFFVNSEANKLVLFNGRQFTVISDLGMMNFFQEKLEFCTEGCTDEHVSGRFYHMGWDHRNRRLLFTKIDGEYSYTMSFDPERQVWISFHSYHPDFYVWDQKHMYSIKNNEIWRHDHEDCDYQTFYGDYSPYIVDFIANNSVSFEFQSTVLNTEAKQCVGCNKLNDRNITFNKAWFRNGTQSTGTMNLIHHIKNDSNKDLDPTEIIDEASLIRTGGEWHLNRMLDRTADFDQPIEDINCCAYQEEPIESNLLQTCPKEFNKNILFNKYLKKRLIFDNFEYKNIELFLRSVYTLIKTNL